MRELALGLDEAGLEVDDVLAQGIVLGLDGLEGFFEIVEFANLFFEFLDVAFFALAECALRRR